MTADDVQHAPVVSEAAIAALERKIAMYTDSPDHAPKCLALAPDLGCKQFDFDFNLEVPAAEWVNEDEHVPPAPCDDERSDDIELNSDGCGDEDAVAAIDPALAALVTVLSNASAGLQSRQRAAHRLARDLALSPPAFGAVTLGRCSPAGPLLSLSQADDSSLTTQLVLSCLTNLASIDSRLVAVECPAVPELLLRALRGGQADAALRSYALTAANNLAHEEAVMATLERAGAMALVKQLAVQCFAAGDEANHAQAVLRALKRAAPRRPSSAAQVLARVSSFSRGRRMRGSE